MLRILDVYPGSRIRIFSIPDPGSASKNLGILTQKLVSKHSEICFELFIPDPDPDFFYPSRIPGSKGHRIPDPDPQHCLQAPGIGYSEMSNITVCRYI